MVQHFQLIYLVCCQRINCVLDICQESYFIQMRKVYALLIIDYRKTNNILFYEPYLPYKQKRRGLLFSYYTIFLITISIYNKLPIRKIHRCKLLLKQL